MKPNKLKTDLKTNLKFSDTKTAIAFYVDTTKCNNGEKNDSLILKHIKNLERRENGNSRVNFLKTL